MLPIILSFPLGIFIFTNSDSKTRGINIERKNTKGERLKIIAEELSENLKNKTIKLKNSVTTIVQKGKITKIFAGVALINENYEDYKLSNEVKIVNKNKNFVLKTKALNGQFKKGTMFSKNNVDIVIGDAKILGKGLKLLNPGCITK